MFGHLNFGLEKDKKFRIYKCSLCYTLGKEYGIMARFFTNYDMALCLLVALSYKKEEVRIKRNMCPLLSINKILPDDLPILKYVAAMTVLLVSEKIKDDIYDEKKKFPKKVLRWIGSRQDKAVSVLKGFGFKTKTVEKAFETQRILERRDDAELFQLTEPTANVMSEIYSFAAIVNGISEYENAFRRIGYLLGQIIYLLDSIVDYRHDLVTRTFNPLRTCFLTERDNTDFISEDIKEKVFPLLKMLQVNIERTLKELPENSYMKNIFVTRLSQKLEEIFETIDLPVKTNFTERIRNALIPSFFSLPGIAFASNRKGTGNGCAESAVSLLFPLFIIFLVYSIMCRGCLRGCCSSSPDKVTVDHGCEGKRIYKRDPCTGEYKDERTGCC